MSKHNRERREARRKANYADAVASVVQPGQLLPGQLYTVTVRHDPTCSLLLGVGVCDCSPEVQAPKRVPRPTDN